MLLSGSKNVGNQFCVYCFCLRNVYLLSFNLTTLSLQAKHSVQRLPAAVEDFLNNEGISFKKPVDGAIEILA